MRVHGICAVGAAALLSACASTPRLPTIANGDTVTLVVVASPQDGGKLDISNEALGTGLANGGGGGALAGGLWGLSCGPFAVLCVPVGALTGALAGGAAGAVVGATGVLGSDKATQLRDRLDRVTRSHDLMAEIDRNVTARAQKYWQVANNQPNTQHATHVTVRLQDLRLMSTRDEQIRCFIQVTVVVDSPAIGGGARRSGTKQYAYLSAYSALPVWLDEGSDFVDTSLTSASQQLAAQIVADLVAR